MHEVSAVEVNINGGTTPQLVANQWVSVDVPITALGGVVANNLTRSDVAQIGITTAMVDHVWYDNIYLHKNTVLSNSNFELASFNVYPNPTNNVWNISSKQNITSVVLFDVMGKKVQEVNPSSSSLELNASDLSSGIYFANITSEIGTKVIKLVKN